MEPFYDAVIAFARGMWVAEGIKFTDVDYDKFPKSGGGVVAINHTGYLDFPIAGRPAFFTSNRKVRFMAKKEVFDNKITGPMMRALKHIPVDRDAGGDAYKAAVAALQSGELIGVYPEATHSRSFELKGFKSGAARMALEADVPIVPVVIWGAQQIWTKGLPKQLGRNHFKIFIGVCDPIKAEGTPEELTARLHTAMEEKLHLLQDLFGPHPQGAPWVPARLGGSAPTLEEANAMDAAELAERKKKKELRGDGSA